MSSIKIFFGKSLAVFFVIGLFLFLAFVARAETPANSSNSSTADNKTVASLTETERTLTESNWTPASRFYGLKTFYEGAVGWLKGLYSKQSQADYLVFLGEKREAELRTVLEKGIPEPKIVTKILNSGYDYFVKIKKLLANASEEIFWSKQNKIMEQLYQEQIDFAKWELRQRIASADIAAKAQPSSMAQWLQAMVAIGQALDQQRQERTRELVADRQYTDEMADYLLAWADGNKKWAENLAQYNDKISPEAIASMQKSADDFAAKVQAIKDSESPNKDDLRKALDAFNDDLNKTYQESLAQAEQKTESNENTPQAAPEAAGLPMNKPAEEPADKPVLEEIPSTTVNEEPLTLNYWAQLFGQVDQDFNIAFSAGGGLAPYYFYLETGVGFPPYGLVLAPSGSLSGTPSMEGDYSFGVCVADTAGNSVCAPVTVTVYPAEEEPEPEPEPVPEPEEEETVITVTSAVCDLAAYRVRMSGTATGPVGAWVRLSSGTWATCSAWVGPYNICERQAGQPHETTWSMSETPDDQKIMELLGSRENNPCCSIDPSVPSCW